MEDFLTLLSGIAWTVVYIDAIRVGFKDKSYAMPLFALGLNLGWELLYAYTSLTQSSGLSLQGIINACWALFDLGIVYTYFRYGLRYWPKAFSTNAFAGWSILVFVTSFALQLIFYYEFGGHFGARYSAFLQNLLMSVLFIGMFVSRQGREGQTLLIAIAKWIGTLAPTILFGIYEQSFFITVLGVFCSVFDLIYIGLLLWDRNHPNTLVDVSRSRDSQMQNDLAATFEKP
jgi:hypothetical protein